MAKDDQCARLFLLCVFVVVTLVRTSYSAGAPLASSRIDDGSARSKFVPGSIRGFSRRSGSNSKTKIVPENEDLFKAIAPKTEQFGFRAQFFLPLRERLYQLKTDQHERFTTDNKSGPDIKADVQDLIDSGEDIENNNNKDKPVRYEKVKQSKDRNVPESEEDQTDEPTNNQERGEYGDEEADNYEPVFIPTKMHARVRHSDIRKLYPYAYLEDPRLRENIIIDKGHTVYSEEGYEDLAYDHQDQEKHSEHDESFADVKHQNPIIKLRGVKHKLRRSQRSLIETNEEIDPESVNKETTRGKSVENLDTKYPYYNSPEYRSSPMRYSENIRNIPRKTRGGTEFYDSRGTPCEEGELEHPEEGAPKRANNRRRKNNLGDEIACFQEKYFGRNPFDSPIFTEDRVEGPSSPFVKRDADEVVHVNAVIPEVILQRAASDPQLKVYFGVMETIKAALDDYDDPEDEFLKSNKKASIFQALARRPRSKYVEADAEMPLADEDLMTEENQNVRTGKAFHNLWQIREPYKLPAANVTQTPVLSRDEYNRLLSSIKMLLKLQIKNLSRDKYIDNHRRSDVMIHNLYDNHRSEYSDDVSTQIPEYITKNIIKNNEKESSTTDDDEQTDINNGKKREITIAANVNGQVLGRDSTAEKPTATIVPKAEEEISRDVSRVHMPVIEDQRSGRRLKYSLITKNESIIQQESTEIENDNNEKNRKTRKHEVHNVEHHADSRIDKYPTIIKDPLKRKYFYADV